MKKLAVLTLLSAVCMQGLYADGYLDRGKLNHSQSIVRPGALQSNDRTVTINEKGIYIKVTYPKVVEANSYFTVTASMRNNIGYARMGGLTLSFPQMTTVAGKVLGNTFDSIDGYPPYSKIYNKYIRKAMRSKYYMIEGWEKKWHEGSKKTMRLRLRAPNAIGKFDVNVRGVLHLGSKNDRYEVTVPKYGTEDQQGYKSKRFNIRIVD